MTLYVYNTLTRQKEEFVPLHEGRVNMYVCGPTVYNDAHLGHGKTYVNFDTIVRYLRYLGYQVLYVQNITDVGHILDSGEDRMLKGAAREKMHPMQVAALYTRRYFRDMDRLNVLRPDIAPRATGHIPEMLELVETLVERGHAYEVNGSVYFSVESFPDYGKLSGRRLEDMQAGSRGAVLPEKRNPADFALWKHAEPEHIMRWKSPWGVGFPGWHIECSVMSTKYLGQPFDIHGGGVENKFPHHECEIAQAEAARGSPFARYWLHNGMLMIRGEEMHKSLGNFVTLEQAYQRWDPLVIRFFILMSHYRGPLDLTEEALDAAGKGYQRLLNGIRAVRQALAGAPDGEVAPEGEIAPKSGVAPKSAVALSVAALLEKGQQGFEASMNDDFNTAGALAALFDMTREVNTLLSRPAPLDKGSLEAIEAAYGRLVGDALGLLPDDLEEERGAGLAPDLIQLLIDTRAQLRQAKQYAAADDIRDKLGDLGVQLKDSPEGTGWTLA